MKIRAKEKKERGLGTKLFLKAERCNSPKCAMARNPHRPGAHGASKRRRTSSELARQWQEHQKLRYTYGVKASQLESVVSVASRRASSTSEKIVEFLERRLDNAIYRLGIAPSRGVARQLVAHGHIFVNGRRVSAASYQVKIGDIISVRPQSKELKHVKNVSESLKKYEPPVWLTIDKEKLEGKVVNLPHDVEMPFDLNLVVDYYSK